MTATTATLASFLLARLDADEAVAREARDEQRASSSWDAVADGLASTEGTRVAWFVRRHDPARVLAEVEAKRRVVDLHQDSQGMEVCDHDDYVMPCPTIRALASAYRDHPEFREEWA